MDSRVRAGAAYSDGLRKRQCRTKATIRTHPARQKIRQLPQPKAMLAEGTPSNGSVLDRYGSVRQRFGPVVAEVAERTHAQPRSQSRGWGLGSAVHRRTGKKESDLQPDFRNGSSCVPPFFTLQEPMRS